MASDRSSMQHWIDERNNVLDEYKVGVKEFIDFALKKKDSKGNIRCPCNECGNLFFFQPDTVTYHLYRFSIIESYTTWDLHEERNRPPVQTRSSSSHTGYRDDDMYDAHEMLRDFREAHADFENIEEEPNATARKFYEMVDNASEPLYPNNANITTLSFTNKLLHFKSRHGCSNKEFDELLGLIGSVLPNDHKLPSTYYDVKKMTSALNMGYEKIDACGNDFMLFYKENSKKTHCDICNTSRYKDRRDDDQIDDHADEQNENENGGNDERNVNEPYSDQEVTLWYRAPEVVLEQPTIQRLLICGLLVAFSGKARGDEGDSDDGGGTESDHDNDRDMSVPYNSLVAVL
ncbi:hypothetical protein AgCh_040077 [Apium graveolens]